MAKGKKIKLQDICLTINDEDFYISDLYEAFRAMDKVIEEVTKAEPDMGKLKKIVEKHRGN